MFDATQFIREDAGNTMDRSPIPEGNYTAKLTAFERRQMKSGNGEMLNAEFTLTVGSAARKCWHNFNMTHTNPKTVEIAMDQLGRFCVAAGFNSINDPWNPVELIDKPVELYITVNDRGYNEIKAFKMPEKSATSNAQKLYGSQPVAPSATPSTDDEIPF